MWNRLSYITVQLKEQLLCSYSPPSAHPEVWRQFRECWRRPYDNFNYSELSFGLLKLITILLKIPPPPDKTSLRLFWRISEKIKTAFDFFGAQVSEKKTPLIGAKHRRKFREYFFRLKLISQSWGDDPCPHVVPAVSGGHTEDRTSVLFQDSQ